MRKVGKICLLTNTSDETHGRQVCEGVFSQCSKYGYSVCVFAMLNEFDSFEKDILEGEKGVYRLPDFARFDGVVIDGVSFLSEIGQRLAEQIYPKILEAGVPAVCLSVTVEGFPTIENSNEEALRTICRHVVETHHCHDVCILTGQKGNPEAESRLQVFLDELGRHGIEAPEEYRIYGDFWYTSGEKLAGDIAAGHIRKPEAIIAASDHMALGVIQKLIECGIRVPEDIIVVGFDLTEQGILEAVPVTSIRSNYAECAAHAIDFLLSKIEPEREILPFVPDYRNMMHIGKSCGCHYEAEDTLKTVQTYLYRTHYNYKRIGEDSWADIGMLLESYIFERLTSSETPEKCLQNIYEMSYIILPFVGFYVCLREDWLDNEKGIFYDYPERFEMVLRRTEKETTDFYKKEDHIIFDSTEMLPDLYAEDASPCVYYFSPIHFGKNGFGYAVLCRDYTAHKKFDLVYRNWIRFVCNALEMSRAKRALSELSVRDNMTGLYNRLGMQQCVEKMQREAGENERLLVGVIDMDGLKQINDTYGHAEGDRGILRLSRAIKAFAGEDEICVRAGGDEFYLIGVGAYDGFDAQAATERFNAILDELGKKDPMEYTVGASIGFALGKKGERNCFEEILSQADANMYRCKQKRKAGG